MRPALLLVLTAGSLLAQDPFSARDWLNRGVAAFKQGQYPDAIAAFTKAVQLDPSFVAGHLYLGTAYMQMYVPGAESPDNLALAANAHAEFQKVLAMDARTMVALQSEASLYLNAKKWDDAKQAYEKVIAVDPNNADAWYSLGFIAWSQWYPAYGKARNASGLKMQDPGPIPDAGIRQQLKADWSQVLQDGLAALDKALTINPNYDDAMAYENLLFRERADLRDTPAEYRSDIMVADQWVQKTLATKKMRAEKTPQGQLQGYSGTTGFPAGGGGGGDRIHVGSTPGGGLLKQVAPVYPASASAAHIEGTVVLQAVIGVDGRPRNLQVVSGHPALIMAAIDAVKQWIYAPTLLNGEPVEVKTTINVPFTLSQ